jgi:soluble lytic murein transglycosylase-like protein
LIKATLIGSLILGILAYAATAGAANINQVDNQSAALNQKPTAAVIPVQPQINQNSSNQTASKSADNQDHPCEVSKNFPESIKQWCDLITQFSHQRDLSPNLIAAVMLQESGGNPLAYSSNGAVGLLQVMPSDGLAAEFLCALGPCFANRPTIQQLEDPGFNIEYGTGMLYNLLQKYGNIRDALAAYGPMNVGYMYADKVLSIYHNLGQ